jgi:hypothetical protein
MTLDEVAEQLERAERLGYRFTTRHQPAAELEQPDWVVAVHTPDGRTLFPGAVDDDEDQARRRAALRVAADIAAHPALPV